MASSDGKPGLPLLLLLLRRCSLHRYRHFIPERTDSVRSSTGNPGTKSRKLHGGIDVDATSLRGFVPGLPLRGAASRFGSLACYWCHWQGFKFGIYGAAGFTTCAHRAGTPAVFPAVRGRAVGRRVRHQCHSARVPSYMPQRDGHRVVGTRDVEKDPRRASGLFGDACTSVRARWATLA